MYIYIHTHTIYIYTHTYIHTYIHTHIHTDRGGTVLRCCATNRKVAGSIPAGVTGIFHWHKILPIALWLLGRLSLLSEISTWIPGAFPGCKGGRCVRLTTLTPSCAIVMKSGNLNFLDPSGPLQACNGTDLFNRQRMMVSRWNKGNSNLEKIMGLL